MIPLTTPPQPRFDPNPTKSHFLYAIQTIFSRVGASIISASFFVMILAANGNPLAALSRHFYQAPPDPTHSNFLIICLAYFATHQVYIGAFLCGLGMILTYVSQNIEFSLRDGLLDSDLSSDRPEPPPDPTLIDTGVPLHYSDGPEPIPVFGAQQAGACEHCQQTFEYWLNACQRTNSCYAYCEACGAAAILSFSDPRMPSLPACQAREQICSALEPYLLLCYCGGRFKRDSSPRCPLCNETLSADRASTYIQPNAFGTRGGWIWQKNWRALYLCYCKQRC